MQAFEQSEYLLCLVHVHTQAIILHTEHLVIILWAAADANQKSPVRGPVLNGIRKQIVEDAF
jgi:hypothetical protein